MLPLLKKVPRYHSSRVRPSPQTNASWWQPRRRRLLTTASVHQRSQNLQFQRLILSQERRQHPSFFYSRYPVAAFSTETDYEGPRDDDEEEAVADANEPPSSEEIIARKDELLKGFIEDLSQVREEILIAVEEENEEQEREAKEEQEEDGEMEFGVEPSLRSRYEDALSQHSFERQRRSTQTSMGDDWLFSSFNSKALTASIDTSASSSISIGEEDQPLLGSSQSTTTQKPMGDDWLFSSFDSKALSASVDTSTSSWSTMLDEEDQPLFGSPQSTTTQRSTDDDWLFPSFDSKAFSASIGTSASSLNSVDEEDQPLSGSSQSTSTSDNLVFSEIGGSADEAKTVEETITDNATGIEEQEGSEEDSVSELPWYEQFAPEPVSDTVDEDSDDILFASKPKEETSSIEEDKIHSRSPKDSGSDDILFPAAPTAPDNDALFPDTPASDNLVDNDVLFPDIPQSEGVGLSDTLFPDAPESEHEGFGDSPFPDTPTWQLGDAKGASTQEGRADELNEIQVELQKVLILLENMTTNDWQLLETEEEEDEDMDPSQIFENLEITAIEDNGGDDDEADQSNDNLTQIENFVSILDEYLLENILSTDECNLILARVATSPELSLDAVMANLLEVYHLMTKHVSPDETTYKILLLTLERRIGAEGTSSDATMVTLLHDMMNFDVKLSSNLLLNLGMRCLHRENNVKVAKRLIMKYALENQERPFRISRRATTTLMNMLARENRLDDAVSLLEKCSEENGLRNSSDTDAVLDAAIRWPDRNRAGKRRDITHVLHSFLEVVMKDSPGYSPGIKAYRNIIVALSRTTKGDPTRWEKLRQPFHALFGRYGRFYPDDYLLRVGLNYCEATRDSELARTLVLRSVDQHASSAGDVYMGNDAGSSINLEAQAMESSWLFGSGAMDDATGMNGSGSAISESTTSRMFGNPEIDSLFGLNEASTLDLPEANESENAVFSGTATNGIELSAAGSSAPSDVKESDTLLFASTAADSFFEVNETGSSTTREVDESNMATVFGHAATENSSGTDQATTPPFSHKVFEKALKVCLAADDLQGGINILDSYSRLSDQYPKQVESDMWSFVLCGFASLGHKPDAIKELFDAMKRKGMKLSDETCGAVIHNMATANRHEEAFDLFNDLKQADSAVQPGLSCYNAIMFSHIKAKAWDRVLNTFEDMKTSGLSPNAATTQGLVIASYRLGGIDEARRQMKEVVAMDVVISRENCRLALKLLMPDVLRGSRNASVTDIQQHLRTMGEEDESLRSSCLNLLRSMRRADIEQRRIPTKNAPLDVLAKRREKAWKSALKDALELEEVRRNQPSKQRIRLSSCT